MAELWQLSLVHPKLAFSKKVKRGEQDKVFKNRLKSSPRLKGRTVLLRKWNSTLISKNRPKIAQKSPKKEPSLKKPKNTLKQMALSSNLYALIAPRLEKILGQTAAQKVPE